MVRVSVSVTKCLIDVKEHFAGDLFVVGHDHSAFADRHVLALLKAKATDITDRSGKFIAAFREKSLGRIFDNRQVMLGGQSHDLVHFAWISEEVCDDDRFGAVADLCGNRFRRNI